ncbi:MAG: hypothetical protein NTZ21_20850 [Actinobacteria bacterium]|nr:hypothetical protein [Actinomycetota bacterium]
MNGPALLALQLVDSRLDAIEGRRKRLPERAVRDAAKVAHAELATERARLQGLVDAAYAAVEQAETAGAELDTKQRRLEAQLKTVIAPREAEALMHEIDLLKAKHSALDDVELEAMDQQANAEEAMALLDQREPELLATLADAQAALDAAEASLAADAAGLMAERGVASAALSEAETSLYTSLKARHGGMGIAQLERHTCTGCHVDLSQVEYEQVVHTPAGELPECPHCARLLVV